MLWECERRLATKECICLTIRCCRVGKREKENAEWKKTEEKWLHNYQLIKRRRTICIKISLSTHTDMHTQTRGYVCFDFRLQRTIKETERKIRPPIAHSCSFNLQRQSHTVCTMRYAAYDYYFHFYFKHCSSFVSFDAYIDICRGLNANVTYIRSAHMLQACISIGPPALWEHYKCYTWPKINNDIVRFNIYWFNLFQ